MTLLNVLLVFVVPFLVTAPGLLFAAVEAPEFFTGRRTRRPRSHWAIA
jgi:hypothetical protein